jgi:hypothetical protein
MSWLSRLFGSTKPELSSLDIVAAYGSSLEEAQLNSAGVRDITDLPFEKARIKEAILNAAKDFKDLPEQIEFLGAGFIMLGRFQPLSNSSMQMPRVEELEAMDEEEFKQHIGTMVARKDGDLTGRRQPPSQPNY